jgi:hypothetical protein
MSGDLKHPEPAADPEKGGLEVTHEFVLPPAKVNETAISEGKTDGVATKEVASPPPRPAPSTKPKRKVSRWILWQLWFNTYRWVRA